MPVAATAAVPPGTMAGLEPVLEQDAAAPRDDGHVHATGPRTAAAPGATDATAATHAGATDPGATGAAGAAGRSARDALGAGRGAARSYAAAVDPSRGRAAAVAATTVARPTMGELREVLDKHAAGNLTFDDVVPLLPHDAREVVGWLYMETGASTRSIDVSGAIHSLLTDNEQPALLEGLVNIIKCERDLQKGMIRWGFATSSSLRDMRGVSLRLRLRRKDRGYTYGSFAMIEPHVLDGFYMDIPDGLRSRNEERRLFELLSRLEPRFLWGSYLDVSPTTRCAGTRYRLYFLGSSVPATMTRDGRMVEELVFLGRRLRVYGEGWYFKDKYLARLDLDHLGRSYGTTTVPPVPTPVPTVPRKPATPAPTAKKSRPAPVDADGFEPARSRKSRRGSAGAPRPASSPETGENRVWSSANAFAVLAEHWELAHAVHRVQHGAGTITTIIPEPRRASGTPTLATSGEYVACLPVSGGTPKRVDVSLDAIIAEISELDAKASSQLLHTAAEADAAASRTHFDLPKLVRTSRVDTLASNLERYPVDFGLQLHALYASDRPTFVLYVRQRLLHRWLRATWGGARSFDKLYTAAFGKKPSQGHVAELFAGLEFRSGLEPQAYVNDLGDEITTDRVATEMVLAVAEVMLAAFAPIFFSSDAALVGAMRNSFGVIASHQGSRCLSSASLAYLLFGTQLGLAVQDRITDLYDGDADMARALSDAQHLYDVERFDYEDRDQVMLHPSEPRLVAGDLANPHAAPPGVSGATAAPVDVVQGSVDVEMVPPVAPAATVGVTDEVEDVEMTSNSAPTATLDVAARG